MIAWASLPRQVRRDVVDAAISDLTRKIGFARGRVALLEPQTARGNADARESLAIQRERVARFDRALDALASLSTT